MSGTSIRVRNLGKRYRIGALEEQEETTLVEKLSDTFSAPFRRAWKLMRGEATGAAELDETIWALRDLSLDVDRGEVVGVVGRNGAGKSTLLKILSRITEPTEGYVELEGRVGSLLEVGTGFHKELTGRENVYLNGAILGMTRKEIDEKFDEIVDFSETGKFVDTPVKHYSDGMRVRLAFSVAAHLEPDILLVDEVLSVGDASFQKKCVGKMNEVAGTGRTVLFVSHNMSTVSRLCERTILLENGSLAADGPTHKVIGRYLRSGLGTSAAREWPSVEEAPGNDVARMLAVRVRSEDGELAERVDIREPVFIEIEYEVLKGGMDLVPSLGVDNEEGIVLFVTTGHETRWRGQSRTPGRYLATVKVPGNFFAEGTHIVGAGVQTLDPHQTHCNEKDVVAFQVVEELEAENTARGDFGGRIPGVVRPKLEWRDERLSREGLTQSAS